MAAPRGGHIIGLSSPPERPTHLPVTSARSRILAAALIAGVLAGPPAALRAQDPMAGMAMDHIMVPKGAGYTVADVEFMQGMIAHHAQAIVMSRMAETHGASAKLLKFTQKIDQSQSVEIRLMQNWLRDNGQAAPDTSSWHTHMMAGMLSAEQLRQLDASHGVEFERNFLEMMIQHHEGALKMVDDLFASPGAGQEVNVSVFANDVVTVQTAEIGLMRRMLSALPGA